MDNNLIEQTLTDYIERSLSGARGLPDDAIKGTRAECAALQKERDKLMLHRLVDQYLVQVNTYEPTDLVLNTGPNERVKEFVGFLAEHYTL